MDERRELAGSLFVNDRSLDADEFSYFGIKASVEYTWLILENWEVHGVLSLGNKAFAADFPGEGEPRKETYINGIVSSDYDFGSWGKVFAGVTYFNNMSNVDIFKTDRITVSAGYVYKIEF